MSNLEIEVVIHSKQRLSRPRSLMKVEPDIILTTSVEHAVSSI